jgi:hypothetical protein
MKSTYPISAKLFARLAKSGLMREMSRVKRVSDFAC